MKKELIPVRLKDLPEFRENTNTVTNNDLFGY